MSARNRYFVASVAAAAAPGADQGKVDAAVRQYGGTGYEHRAPGSVVRVGSAPWGDSLLQEPDRASGATRHTGLSWQDWIGGMKQLGLGEAWGAAQNRARTFGPFRTPCLPPSVPFRGAAIQSKRPRCTSPEAIQTRPLKGRTEAAKGPR
jgi:hypothetical protein